MVLKSVYFYNPDILTSVKYEKLKAALDGIFRVYLPYQSFTDREALSAIKEIECEKAAVLPYINKGNARNHFEKNFNTVCKTADGFMIQNIGDLAFLSGLFQAHGVSDKFVYGDYSLNVFNSESAAYWNASGLKSVTVSPEPEASEQIKLANSVCKLQNGTMLPEIICGGKIIVMRSEHCFITDNPKYHCVRCGKNGMTGYSLTDNAENKFPVIGLPHDCQNIVLSAKNIEIAEEYAKKHLLGNCILRYNVLNEKDLLNLRISNRKERQEN
ncbi:MAG: hypothetical protein IJZ94_00800 [Clostridia bacterium]|nr:hypothetical protein [Clostridia bacterium]